MPSALKSWDEGQREWSSSSEISQNSELKEADSRSLNNGELSACLVAQMVKNPPAMQETRSEPWVRKIWNGNRLQYSCLKNSKDRGAWWATVHGVAKRRT